MAHRPSNVGMISPQADLASPARTRQIAHTVLSRAICCSRRSCCRWGLGRSASPRSLPALIMVTGYGPAVLIPSRRAEDLFAGWRRLIGALCAVPQVLAWDGEGAIGRWCGERTSDCQAFRRTLGAKVVICRPVDPEAKGLERAHAYLQQRGSPSAGGCDCRNYRLHLSRHPSRALSVAPQGAT